MSNQRLSYLVQAVAENSDEQAFDELFRIFYPALLSYATSLIKDRPVAEEICIDVLFKLWQNRKMLLTIKNLSHYLYIATKHGVISYTRSKEFKSHKKSVSLEDVGESLTYELKSHENRLIDKETLSHVNLAINALPARCRLIFKLIKEDGLKYAEVAQLLEISVKTVENQISIAMKKLVDVMSYSFKKQKKNTS